MYGGTCINTGCVPTKSMVYRGELAGVQDPDVYASAVATTERLTSGLRAANHAALQFVPSVTLLTGAARFRSENEVTVTTEAGVVTVRARNIVVGTGAVPVYPDLPGLRECPVTVTSAELLQTVARPDRLVILGGGYIGLEFASMYAAFGASVTVLEQRPTILGNEDPDVAEVARALLDERGIAIRTGVNVVGVETILRPGAPPAARVEYLDGGNSTTVEADNLLIALGRTPNTARLDLQHAGVEVTDTGAVVVDDYRRTSQPHIFAVGDVNGGPQFTYISLDDYRIVADQLNGVANPRRASDRRAVPNCLFLSPPLARVGLTETQARNAGYQVQVAVSQVVNLATVARARIVGDARGMMKIVVDGASDQILGAALLCHDAQEIINIVALAMRYRVPAGKLRDEVYTHPSMAECFNQLLGLLR